MEVGKLRLGLGLRFCIPAVRHSALYPFTAVPSMADRMERWASDCNKYQVTRMLERHTV